MAWRRAGTGQGGTCPGIGMVPAQGHEREGGTNREAPALREPCSGRRADGVRSQPALASHATVCLKTTFHYVTKPDNSFALPAIHCVQ